MKDFMTIIELLQWRAEHEANQCAYVFLTDQGEEKITYSELNHKAQIIARLLLEENGKGERVMLFFNPGLDYIIAFFGCLYAGAIAVPAYPPKNNRHMGRLQAIINNAGAKYILTSPEVASRNKFLEKVFIVDAILFNEKGSENININLPTISSSDLAFLQYTSGSTGDPKGVMVNHANLMNNTKIIAAFFCEAKPSGLCSWLPPYHDMGLIGGIVYPLYEGFLSVLMSPIKFLTNPIQWLKAISHYKTTVSPNPNFAYKLCVDEISEAELEQLDLSHWKIALNGSEPINKNTIDEFCQKFKRCGFKPEYMYPAYGMAETTLMLTGKQACTKNDYHNGVVSCGKPKLGHEIIIVDNEIWAKGPSVAQGYWNNSKLTKEIFNNYLPCGKGPYLRTGDLGFQDKKGNLYVTGRLKDVIIIHGNNYYPQDIEESVEKSHPDLMAHGCAAFSDKNEKDSTERLVVVQEVKRHTKNVDKIFQEIQKSISQNHELSVSDIILIRQASLPKTSSGKIQRFATKKEYLEGSLKTVAEWHAPLFNLVETENAKYIKPFFEKQQIQAWLKNWIMIKKGVSEIDMSYSFSAYGFDSVLAIQLCSDLSEYLNKKINPALLWEYPTIESFVKFLSHHDDIDFIASSHKEHHNDKMPIAIIGMAGIFPGSENLDEFWNNIKNGKNCISEIPKERWDYTQYNIPKWGGFIENIDKFDASFFNISPREAELMDPQQRLFLQMVWKAMESAGYSPEIFATHQTGLYVGVSSQDYVELIHGEGIKEAYIATGNAHSILANRISYLLNLTGPSQAIDTACSSSLVALHQAVKSIEVGDCQLAIIGGVNALLTPTLFEAFAQAGMLSPDGQCKTFDQSANGYVRGEGVGVIILKPLYKALTDKDSIYGVIRGSSVNHGGNVNTLTAPNPNAQAELIIQAYKKSNIKPEEVTYIETHGTGTSLGDPIEINGLKKAFKELNPNLESNYCALGAVKANIGHLEAAAGIAGVIKVLLMLKHKQIPPQANFTTINPNIELEHSSFYIPNENQAKAWEVKSKRIAGISSFGFGGTNAHVVIEEGPEQIISNHQTKPYYLITLSAKHEDALKQKINDLVNYIQINSDRSIESISYTLNVGRSCFHHRIALVVSHSEELKEKLENRKYFQGDTKKEIDDRAMYDEMPNELNEKLKVISLKDKKQYKKHLLALAKLYVKGYDLDWQLLHQGEAHQKISLPTYPFLKERYWVSSNHNEHIKTSAINNQRITQLHPLIGQNVSTLDEQSFTTRFAGNEFYLTDHLVQDHKVLPGVAYIEMARAAAELAAPGKKVIELRDIFWLSPLKVDDKTSEVKISLNPQSADIINYKITTGNNAYKVIHGQGKVIYAENKGEVKAWSSVAILSSQLMIHIVADKLYAEFKALGLQYGNSFQALQWIKTDGHSSIGFYQLPSACESEARLYILHPGILDSILQTAMGIFTADKEQLNHLYLPFALEQLIIYQGLPKSGYAYVKPSTKGNRENLSYDFQVWNEAGEVCLELIGLQVRAVSKELSNQKTEPVQLHYYAPIWQERLLSSVNSASDTHNAVKSILVFSNDKALVTALRKDFKVPVIQISLDQKDDYEKILTNLQKENVEISHILFARALNQNVKGSGSHDSFDHYLNYELREQILFTQLLMCRKMTGLIQLFSLYTVSSFDELAWNTMLSGYAKSLMKEHPQYRLKIIGIDKKETLEKQITHIKHALVTPALDVHIRYFNNRREVEQYEEINAVSSDDTVPWCTQGVYLITGGLGGLGFIVAEYLAKTYQAKLILAGRSTLDVEKETKIKKLEECGSAVLYLTGDVSDEAVVENWIIQSKSHFGKINGVIHIAGVIKDALLINKSWAGFTEVLLPKIRGTINLDIATQAEELDSFVLFSSIASCFGNVGQTDYSLANTFLDRFADWRDHQVKAHNRTGKTLSINWPYWSEGGMQIDVATQQHFETNLGIKKLSSEQGLEALSFCLKHPWKQCIVLHGVSRLIQKTVKKTNAEQGIEKQIDHEQSTDTFIDMMDLSNKLKQSLKNALSRVLKVSVNELDDEEDLKNYGIDSIIAINLIQELEKDFSAIPKTLFFDYHTLSELTDYFMENHYDQVKKIVTIDHEVWFSDLQTLSHKEAEVSPEILVNNISSRFVSLQDLEENKFKPFPLNDMQESFLAGRYITSYGDKAGCHIYFEIEKFNLDISLLNQAWNKLNSRHDMLHAVIFLNGEQRIIRDFPPYLFKVHTLQGATDVELSRHLSQVRQRMSHKIYEPQEYPLFTIEVTACESNRFIIHFSIDELIVDAMSVMLLLAELTQLYKEPHLLLPPLETSFRDYILELKASVNSVQYNESLSYWLRSLNGLPQDPFLRNAKLTHPLANKETLERRALNGKLSLERWRVIKNKAKAFNLSPSILLLSLFLEVIALSSDEETFSIILTTLNRLPTNHSTKRLIGPFASTLIFIKHRQLAHNLIEIINENQQQIMDGLLHSQHISGIRALRELKARRQVSSTVTLGIVFTSLMDSYSALNDDNSSNWYADASYRVMQTPQVYLEHQTWENKGELHFTWYVIDAIFEPDLLQNLFNDYCDLLTTLADEKVNWEKPYFHNEIKFKNFPLVIDTENKYQAFPVTDIQQAYLVWRTDKLFHGNMSCTNYQEFKIKNVDIQKLQNAWGKLITVHDMLRAIITTDSKQKIVTDVPDYSIEVINLSMCNKNEISSRLETTREKMLNHVFPLNHWPFFDLKITLIDSLNAILHFSIDLLIADGNSIYLLYLQLFHLYENPNYQLMQPKLSFKNYIDWLQRYNQSNTAQHSLRYWQKKFSHIPDGSHVLPKGQINNELCAQPKILTHQLQKWDAIKNKLMSLHIPPDMILLTAYAEALSQLCQEPFTIVVVGWQRLPIHREIDSLVGDFSHLSWITVNPTEKLSLMDKLLNYHQQLANDNKHMAVSGLKVLRRTLKNNKLMNFPVVYTSLTTHSHHHSLPHTVEMGYRLSKTPQVNLDAIAFEKQDVLNVQWDLVTTISPSGEIEEIFNYYCHLLEWLAVNTEDWERFTADNPARQSNFVPEKNAINCLHALIEHQVTKTPTLIAAQFLNEQMSYQELNNRANQLAHYLIRQGIKADDIVAIMVERSLDMLIGLLAILKAGAAYLPLDPTYPDDRLSFILEDAKITVVFTQNKFMGRNLDFKGILLSLDTDHEFIQNESSHNPKISVGPTNLAYVIYTSGSTGKPKGCMLTHEAICNRLVWMQETYALTAHDRVLQKTPFTFDVSVWEFFWPLMSGASICFAKPGGHKDSHYLVDFIQAQQITVCHFVPSMLTFFLSEKDVSQCSSLKHVFTSGEVLSYPLMMLFLQKLPTKLHNLYGPTEAAVDVTSWECQPRADKLVPIGKPISHIQIYILDEHLNAVPEGTVGELFIGGIGLARGYLNRVSLTQEKFITNPFNSAARLYKTGDLAKFLPDGNIHYMGRTDSQVKLRGFRIELGEIEHTLLEYPRLNSAVVIVRNEHTDDPKLVAYIVVENPESNIIDNLRAFLRNKLPEYCIPNLFVLMNSVPITQHGKVDRHNLPWPLTHPVYEDKTGNTPMFKSELIEQKIVDIFKELLNLSSINIHDDLFTLGATSLTIVRAGQKIQSLFNYNLPIETFLLNPTLNGIIQYIAEKNIAGIEGQQDSPIVNSAITHVPDINFFSEEERRILKEKQLHLRKITNETSTIHLNLSIDQEADKYRRSSQYNFKAKPISFANFCNFLSLLKQHVINGEIKYLYPSAGKTYAVQTYLYIKEHAIEGLQSGIYYYHPVQHDLVLITKELKLDSFHQVFYNREHFEKAGFCIYFIAQLEAITPIYGNVMSNQFVILEAGYIGQLLMLNQSQFNIGLCPIGGIDFEKIRPHFQLNENHFFIHSMLGGYIDYPDIDITYPKNFAKSTKATQLAIVGIGGRYPQANSIDELWDNLQAGRQSFTKLPPERGKYQSFNSLSGGYLSQIDRFDHLLFHITPEEARSMDPQERLFLEVVWECLENAGYTCQRLNESAQKVGVFVGAMWNDYQNLGVEAYSRNEIVLSTSLHSSIANRVSYYFDFKGPSIAVDTSCSSSLTAIHLACESIKKGECHAAIVGGVNLLSHPYHQTLLKELGLLSNKESCLAYSADSTGWIAGEGVGAILILSLELAEKNHDYIYGLIKGSSIMHLGKTTRFAAPSVEAEIESIKNTLSNAHLLPEHIDYIETAATGAQLADAAEIAALKQVFKSSDRNKSCPIGTIKPNIGHLEAASGISQLTKVLLQLQYKKITPTLFNKNQHSFLDLENSPFYVSQDLIDWKSQTTKPLTALVNSFGATGSCGHVILEEYSNPSLHHPRINQEALIVFSAATQQQLNEYIERFSRYLEKQTLPPNFCDPNFLYNIAYTLQIGRQAMSERIAIITLDIDDLKIKLTHYLGGKYMQEKWLYIGTVNKTRDNSIFEATRHLNEIAERWVQGINIKWEQLYNNAVKKIPLPTYPFSRDSHWIRMTGTEQDKVSSIDLSKPDTMDDNSILLQKTIGYLKVIFSQESEINIAKIDADITLDNYGITSFLITKLTTHLEKKLGPLSKTLFFEYKTLSELANYFVINHKEKLCSLLNVEDNVNTEHMDNNLLFSSNSFLNQISHDEIAIIGISGRYPQAKNLEMLWNNLKSGKDSITEIPSDRWDNEYYHQLLKNKFGNERIYSRWGGFLEDVDRFDPLFFNISPINAEMMDPQERLFLEVVWETLEDAGYTKQLLKTRFDNQVGVYVGVMYSEYVLHAAEKIVKGEPLALSLGYGSIANQVSYFLDLEGPSMAIDTLCSSSLTAVHLACESLQLGNCQLAIAGGVNLVLHPHHYILHSQMHMSSSDGRCRSFGEGGDGFVAGEGVGAILLKPLQRALADGDRIYGIIKGSAVNHGGHTHGYTVPNPNAHARLIQAAFKKANIEPSSISYIEAHGTGTSLGDPIEISGLTKTWGDNAEKQNCPIGSIKSNIGHLESAAGIAALTKVLLQLKHKQLVPSIHSEILNPNINFSQTPFYVQKELSEWKSKNKYPRRAGISSFGAGGSNAHIIIEEGPEQKLSQIQVKPYYLVTLSAKHQDSLYQRIKDLHQFLINQSTKIPLEVVAYTLNTGRSHFDHRIAFVVTSSEELMEKMVQVEKGEKQEGFYQGNATKGLEDKAIYKQIVRYSIEKLNEFISQPLEYKELLEALANLYVKGYDIDWQLLHQGEAHQKISLPTYPFMKERYWVPVIPMTSSGNVITNAKAVQLHPLVGQNVSTLEEQSFTTRFAGNEFYLTDHLVQDHKVLPGVAYIEMASAAAELAAPGKKVTELRDIFWLSPLKVDDKTSEVKISLNPQSDEAISYEITTGDNENKVIHGQGEVIYAENKGEAKAWSSLTELSSQLVTHIEADKLYAEFRKLGLQYGERFQALQWIKTDGYCSLGHYRLPPVCESDERLYVLHPGILDSILQTAMGIFIPDKEQSNDLHLPFALAQLIIYQELPKSGYAYVKPSTKANHQNLSYDFQVWDEKGEVCLELIGLQVRAVSKELSSQKAERAQLQYYVPIWQEQLLSSVNSASDAHNSIKSILLFSNDEALAIALRKELVVPVIQLRLDQKDEYEQILTNLQKGNVVISHILFAQQLSTSTNVETKTNGSSDPTDNYLNGELREIILFTQLLMKKKVTGPINLYSIYHLSSSHYQAPYTMLSGFAKSLVQEHPQYHLRVIGIDKELAIEQHISLITTELLTPISGVHVRYVGNSRQVEQYEKIEKQFIASETAIWKKFGVYLITGGLGGLGFILAEYLAKNYQAKLILTGRSAFTEDKQAKLNLLKNLSSEAVYLIGDVADESTVKEWINQAKTQFGQINGIIHSAGIIKDGLLINKSWEEFRQVLTPKVIGTINLDLATRDEKLDCFILFSSIASCFGNVGQTDYATGNAFIDEFAKWRDGEVKEQKRFGMTVAINWPYWQEGGMRIDAATQQYIETSLGLKPLPTPKGLEALLFCLMQPSAQCVVLYGMPLQYTQIVEQINGTKTVQHLKIVSSAELSHITEKLIQALKEVISQILKVEIHALDEEDDLSDYGFDSITFADLAYQLKQQYKISITPAIFFDYPTINQFAKYLIGHYPQQLVEYYELENAGKVKPAIQPKINSRLSILSEKEQVEDAEIIVPTSKVRNLTTQPIS